MNNEKGIRFGCFLFAYMLIPFMLYGCSAGPKQEKASSQENEHIEPDTSGFIVAVEEEPDTVDFQCTSERVQSAGGDGKQHPRERYCAPLTCERLGSLRGWL